MFQDCRITASHRRIAAKGLLQFFFRWHFEIIKRNLRVNTEQTKTKISTSVRFGCSINFYILHPALDWTKNYQVAVTRQVFFFAVYAVGDNGYLDRLNHNNAFPLSSDQLERTRITRCSQYVIMDLHANYIIVRQHAAVDRQWWITQLKPCSFELVVPCTEKATRSEVRCTLMKLKLEVICWFRANTLVKLHSVSSSVDTVMTLNVMSWQISGYKLLGSHAKKNFDRYEKAASRMASSPSDPSRLSAQVVICSLTYLQKWIKFPPWTH